MTPETHVTFADGTVRGTRLGDLLAWRGIPYAAPPVGPLRLRAPQPVEPWTGVRDATQFGNAAPQRPRYAETGRRGVRVRPDEDCLTLNVLAPAGRVHAPRPVMVFIHGGAFTLGTSALSVYGGESLVRRGDVVYVSINYRLGALGYLDFGSFSTDSVRFDSNLGLRDQVAALEWVQRNIAAFGGDPDNVTIFGESAGGTSVTTLLATPAARGLFSAAIAQSPAPNLVVTSDRSAEWGRKFVELLGADPDTAAQALLDTSPVELGRVGSRLGAQVLRATPGLHPFGPVVDGDFVPLQPLEAYETGAAHPVPLVLGTNDREGALFPKFLDALPTNPRRIDALFAATDPEAKDRITGIYPGYPDERAAIDLGGDLTFWYPSVQFAQAHSRFAPTFMYRFDLAPRVLRWTGFDATHAVELLAVFDQTDEPLGRALTALGGRRGLRTAAGAMQRQWLNVARHGEPLPSWPPYDEKDRATVIFDEVTRIEHDPRRERRLAWEGYRGYAAPAPVQ
ncbi:MULTISPECIES: carboxylesterase/lipase family protein [unclassified Rhodococcus (in: high G+C Gram-positive bacteria)]|uniref:carboxylesterase/lipase family protein n=1 Tax=unclassified Rhodococcus (in: high G+C Gram-positive bacteria) TaxID=192944 RepID=UPI0009043DB0|nr:MULTISPECIES: carboxylesterase/lipase family protein [unclassified Rhodococcus (in: high G+C Gram-positive bacteria)]APE08021.1 carboxylesterase [Rhodococcus sp. 2G]QXU54616.1 carboxylesterase/lipase family protein [Rhodococcus sp. LW-XY12]